MSEQSSTSESLFLLDSATDFREHALAILGKGKREVYLLSSQLDFPLYDNSEFCSALSTLARSSRYVEIKILIKDTQPLIDRGHKVLQLAKRLSSKITIHKLALEPENDDMAFLIVDDYLLLYKNDDREYAGFVNYEARPEVRNLLDTFQRLWQQSGPDPQLQQFNL